MENKRILLIMIISVCFVSMINNILYSAPRPEDVFKDKDIVKFMKYVRTNNEGKIKEMIDNGVNIDYENEQKMTPLYYFFLTDEYKSFKKMLELGANPNVHARGLGLGFLLNATMQIKDDRYFKLLLEHGVDIDYIPPKDEGSTVLHFALFSTIDIKYLKMLIEHGVNPYYSDFWGNVPIFSALSNREYKKVILLLDYYPDYLKDERKYKLHKGEFTIKEIFIEDLESEVYVQSKGSKWQKEQQELVKYLKDKFDIDVKLMYPEGR